MLNSEKSMEKIVALCKGRGFVFPGSEIYGGLANSWDYGPLGVLLKNNVKAAWWKRFVTGNPHNVGLDGAILMNSKAWVASGHVGNFNDPLTDCRACKTRHRADQLIENHAHVSAAGWDFAQMSAYMKDNGVPCPDCGAKDFTEIRQFNMMFKTYQGVTEDGKNELYLRPETAQAIFVNFKNIQRSARRKVPFGVGQIGKSFRNEITPGNFTFRTREFEQMELEFFCKPGTDAEWFAYWRAYCEKFLLDLGLRRENFKLRDHDPKELSHYSNATTDIEFLFPFGWGELWGIADRTDFDLSRHAEVSGQAMDYFDPETNEKYIPYVIEPSLGADRVTLAFLIDAYDEEPCGEGDIRTVLRLSPALAPYSAAVLPLSKKLGEKAEALYHDMMNDLSVDYDDAGSIGKRYRRQDEIGTPFCVTIDFDTLEDGAATIRERDAMTQERIPLGGVKNYIAEKIRF